MKKWIISTSILLVALLLTDIFLLKSYPLSKGLLYIKGAYIVIGVIVGSIVMIAIKSLGEWFLYRNSEYYKNKKVAAQ